MSVESVMFSGHIAYDLYEHTSPDGLEYTYRGNVNSDVVENILSLAETNFGDMKEKLMVRKKVYFIMVESLQNITRHQELDGVTGGENFDQYGLFIIRRGRYGYYITSANLVKNEHCEKLKEKLDIVNSKDSDELKIYSRQILANGEYSQKGGAGLGLIEIARKAGSKIKYGFVPTECGYSRFYQHVDVLFNKKDADKPEVQAEIQKYSLDRLIAFHLRLQQNRIFLHYSGILNQENLINLLGILSRQINVSKGLRTKVYCVMIELLQNILAHADKPIKIQNVQGCFGMFFIRQTDEHLILSAANHILTSKIPETEKLIDSLNETDKEERARLLTLPDTKGNGLIAIINRSKHKIQYDYTELNDQYSLFSMTIMLDKDVKRDTNV
ncbi:MAG: SiaB family protein kinase [Bacteroidales bacterium]|jgi:hypothetical protein|nr:SiaB family protein kinase [Bacteroidales bacterium]